MKIKVIAPFADKFTYAMYAAGDNIEVADARAKDLISRGLCAAVEISAKEPIKEKKAPIKKGKKIEA